MIYRCWTENIQFLCHLFLHVSFCSYADTHLLRWHTTAQSACWRPLGPGSWRVAGCSGWSVRPAADWAHSGTDPLTATSAGRRWTAPRPFHHQWCFPRMTPGQRERGHVVWAGVRTGGRTGGRADGRADDWASGWAGEWGFSGWAGEGVGGWGGGRLGGLVMAGWPMGWPFTPLSTW